MSNLQILQIFCWVPQDTSLDSYVFLDLVFATQEANMQVIDT